MKRHHLFMGVWLAALGLPAVAHGAEPSRMLLKAKPAVVVVRTEISASVRLACPGQSPRRVSPPPQRSHGSGYLLSPDGYIATNGHAVQAYYQDDDREAREELVRQAIGQACLQAGLPEDRRPAAVRRLYPRIAPGAAVELRKTLTVVLPNQAQFEGEVKAYSPALAEGRGRVARGNGRVTEAGKDVAILKIDARNLPMLPLADSDGVRVGDRVTILGFPGVVMEHDFLDKRTALEATATTGLVSSLKKDARGTPVIQTEAAASWGDSGGPAVNERGEVVGMMTFISLTSDETQAIQGFNFLVPSNVVKEFARAAGTPIGGAGTSPFNAVWHEAVDRFARKDWAGALSRLEAANRLVPNLPDVQRLQVEAQLNLLQASPWPGRALVGGLAAAGLAMASGAWILLRRRRRTLPARESHDAPRASVPVRPPLLLPPGDLARALAQRLPLALVDVRAAESRLASGLRAKDAVQAEPDDVLRACAAYPRDQPIVLYCDSPGEERSLRAARHLGEAGYTRVAVLAGGFAAWQEAGLGLERTGQGRLSTPQASALPLPAPAEPSALERRVEFPVGVKGAGPYFNARATAVRTSGLTLLTAHALTPGESVRLTIFLGGETLELRGRAVAGRPGTEAGTTEVEVAFDPLNEEAAVTLEGFILARGNSGAA